MILHQPLHRLVQVSKKVILPYQYPNTVFAHFSLPAYDAGNYVLQKGSSIKSAKFVVPDNTILVSKLNPYIPRIWKPDTIPDSSVCSTEFLILVPYNIDRDYLYYYCCSDTFWNTLVQEVNGSTKSHKRLSNSTILNVEIIYPESMDEQKQWAKQFSTINDYIQAIQDVVYRTELCRIGLLKEITKDGVLHAQQC